MKANQSLVNMSLWDLYLLYKNIGDNIFSLMLQKKFLLGDSLKIRRDIYYFDQKIVLKNEESVMVRREMVRRSKFCYLVLWVEDLITFIAKVVV